MGNQIKLVVAVVLIFISTILLSSYDGIDVTTASTIKKNRSTFYSQVRSEVSNVTSRRTAIIKQTAGTITLSNICLRYKTTLDSNNTAIYTDEIELLSHQNTTDVTKQDAVYIMHLKRRDYLVQTVPIKDELEWIDMIEEAEWISSDNDGFGTVWMYDWKEANNPGHCMNDFAFSTALDLDDTNPTAINRQPYYDYFIHARYMHLMSNCTTFCCKLFVERFGLIDYETQIIPSIVAHIERPALCFDKITFPKLEAVRHVYNDNVNTGIQSLRLRSWNMMKELNALSWTDEKTTEDSNSTTPKILLFDRFDAASRHLVNASDILLQLNQSYNVETYHISGHEWSNATLLQQAVLFNSYQYIISPHGAHLFNIIHARPQTKVLEIQCLVTNRRWNLHQNWFSKWQTAIDVDWRVYTEMEGCKENGQILTNYSPKIISVDVEKVVQAAIEHFNLKPR